MVWAGGVEHGAVLWTALGVFGCAGVRRWGAVLRRAALLGWVARRAMAGLCNSGRGPGQALAASRSQWLLLHTTVKVRVAALPAGGASSTVTSIVVAFAPAFASVTLRPRR